MDLGENDAVRLFVQRAGQIRPGFQLTGMNSATIGEIVRRLDGLPLAIELAAARIRLLPPEARLARLDRALPVLIGGARELPARQQTMRAAIQWSVQLLSQKEQTVFRRLSVFSGDWDLDAAETVVASDDVPAEEVLDLLSSLVEQSLVLVVPGVDGGLRYRLFVRIRQFAHESLEVTDELDAIRRRHTAQYRAFVRRGRTQTSWPGSGEVARSTGDGPGEPAVSRRLVSGVRRSGRRGPDCPGNEHVLGHAWRS